MSKKTKLLLVLLSATALTAGAMGIASCAGNPVEGSTYYQQYQTYVAQAEADGEQALSFDEWMTEYVISEVETVKGDQGDKGDKGDKGDPGVNGATWSSGEGAPADTTGANGDFYLDTTTYNVYNKKAGAWVSLGSIKGAAGANGVAGNGIQSATYADGVLKITYTSGNTDSFKLVDVHTYGEVETIIPATTTTSGVGIKPCTVAGHEDGETVVIPKSEYTVTVVDMEGNPVEGVTVYVGGDGYSDTDKEGKVKLSTPQSGEYVFTVSGYVVIGANKTTVMDRDYTLTVAPDMVYGEISESGIYGITIGSYAGNPEFNESSSVFTAGASLKSGEDRLQYKITLLDKVGVMTDMFGATISPEADGTYLFNLKENDYVSITFSADKALFENGTYKYGEDVRYAFKVEILPAAPDGTVPEYTLDGDALVSDTGLVASNMAKDTWLYYTWNYTMDEDAYTHLQVELGEGNELQMLVYLSDGTSVYVSPNNGVVQFSDSLSWPYNLYNFRVRTSTGNVSVKGTYFSPEGSEGKPANLPSSNSASGTLAKGASYFYKWTVPADGRYAVEAGDGTYVRVGADTMMNDEHASANSGKGVFNKELKQGDVCYIKVTSNSGDYSFSIRAFDEEKDKGYIPESPIEIDTTTESLSFSGLNGGMYYVFTNDTEAAVNFDLGITNPDMTAFYFITTFDDYFNCYYNGTPVTVEAGEKLYVMVQYYGGFTGTVDVLITEPEEEQPGEETPEEELPAGAQDASLDGVTGEGTWYAPTGAYVEFLGGYISQLSLRGEDGAVYRIDGINCIICTSGGTEVSEFTISGSYASFMAVKTTEGNSIFTVTLVSAPEVEEPVEEDYVITNGDTITAEGTYAVTVTENDGGMVFFSLEGEVGITYTLSCEGATLVNQEFGGTLTVTMGETPIQFALTDVVAGGSYKVEVVIEELTEEEPPVQGNVIPNFGQVTEGTWTAVVDGSEGTSLSFSIDGNGTYTVSCEELVITWGDQSGHSLEIEGNSNTNIVLDNLEVGKEYKVVITLVEEGGATEETPAVPEK